MKIKFDGNVSDNENTISVNDLFEEVTTSYTEGCDFFVISFIHQNHILYFNSEESLLDSVYNLEDNAYIHKIHFCPIIEEDGVDIYLEERYKEYWNHENFYDVCFSVYGVSEFIPIRVLRHKRETHIIFCNTEKLFEQKMKKVEF